MHSAEITRKSEWLLVVTQNSQGSLNRCRQRTLHFFLRCKLQKCSRHVGNERERLHFHCAVRLAVTAALDNGAGVMMSKMQNGFKKKHNLQLVVNFHEKKEEKKPTIIFPLAKLSGVSFVISYKPGM